MRRLLASTTWWQVIVVMAGLAAIVVVGIAMLQPRKSMHLGAAVALDPLLHEPQYAATLRDHFGMVTPEVAMKFEIIHPARNYYAFGDADTIVRFALENGMQVRGHTLVWHNQLPAWIREGNFTSAELRDILHDHIDTLARHYRGRVVAWDVVNEPFADDGSLRDTIWLRALGPTYIEQAFRWAHDADPGALLYLNEYGTERDGPKLRALTQLVYDLKARNVPIDGVGFQMHLNLRQPPTHAEIATALRHVAQAGVRTDITELDVEVYGSSKGDDARLVAQADVYQQVALACLQEPACTAFTTWGISDKHSWISQQIGQPDAPLLFDEHYQPKLAYQAVINTFGAALATQH